MSAFESALTPPSHFMSAVLPVPVESPRSAVEALASRYEEVARLSQATASIKIENLPHGLIALLRPILPCDSLDVVIFNHQRDGNVCDRSAHAGQLLPLDIPIEETTVWSVYQEQQPLWVADWQQDERSNIRTEAQNAAGAGYRSLCRLPLRTPQGCAGVLSIAGFRPHRYSEHESRLLLLVADQVALGLANRLGVDAQRRIELELDKTNARMKLLAELNHCLAGDEKLDSFLTPLTMKIRQLTTSDIAVLGLLQSDYRIFQVKAFDANDDVSLRQESVESLGHALWERVGKDRHWTGQLEDASRNQLNDSEWMAAVSMTYCLIPLVVRDRLWGMLALGGRRDSYCGDELCYLKQLSTQLAVVLENLDLRAESLESKDKVDDEKSCVDHELFSEPSFENIVGRSPALQRVLRQVEIVAPTDSSVLIHGETGTGKELIAQAIHNRSSRRDRPFIKVNCAAIPSGLLESELFGHEKGAFTGAIMRKPGRFEVADKGTIFLDEVGDIPLELQSKLLRVLQEREFERLGSMRTQQVDVRIIAATHRDLTKMVEDGTFRSDLYYRLHVFPLALPPLRERREDIPLVVHHYVKKYARRMNRCIDAIPARTIEALANYPWPGNVRELQNFVERAVILSPGRCLCAPLDELKQKSQQDLSTSTNTIEKMEREHVLRALRECNWVTGGPNGAAVRLGMKRTTLAYRIRKLKIPCRPA